MKYSHLSESEAVKTVSEEENKGIFHIEGLYTGYGPTLGNALRRALLSSLPGAAITQVKVKGVDHEFSTLPGMLEDIVEFILNLKKVRFHFFADEPQTLTLRVKGERKVTAADIQPTTLVQVVNPSLPLATLTKKGAELDMELTVEKGLGYVPAEARRLERLPVGTIVLDAIFSPVVRVAFSVENMRVGERTDYNRLILEIETDGSISPSEALHKAGKILTDHFEKVVAIEFTKIEATAPKQEKKREKKTK
ncbi:DNA-directed RNA polymerase subunit alpha [Candidatus Jorgensenbacteria bacterium CG23_combo_of_CG06-09_8_20_14_all_54_14]|uniref:DNA-directed RNA polymerase subunit alpha n=1 Tax=Candidatus Jorgensenbacteria bacterium CG23_combo_of_CG06-09_8_20_14_all_54_14 TaxID=1974595 RepID=A0A2G9Z9I8_9BACT|nr:MAG: DNA-directed RNA polymerase subunit alpha [Candidatus Jorgensenbacteria bacterium CG23_combo_of_CG06-09_8_20_14_all_54_14]